MANVVTKRVVDAIEEVVQILECEIRTDTSGADYAKVRADFYIRRDGQRTGKISRYTIMVRDKAYASLREHLHPAAELLVLGHYRRVFAGGRPGGFFFEAVKLVEVLGLDRPEPANDDDQRGLIEGHERKRHFRKYRNGVLQKPDDWIPVRASKVNGGRKAA